MARIPALLGVVAAGAALTACGGVGATPPTPPPTGSIGNSQPFPAAGTKTLSELRRGLGPGPQMASSVSVLEPGRDRVAFALFDRTRRQIGDTPAALYVARADGSRVHGPFQASYQPLTVDPRFRSRTVTGDADSAQSIYVASAPFPAPGRYRVLGVAQLDQRLVGGSPVTVWVHRHASPPAVGQMAPRVHTPTRASVRGNLAAIDTRHPPGTMHDLDLADVLGKRPVMLLFASPGLCRSHTCAPVADVMEQLKAEHGDQAAFVKVEIFNNNRPQDGERPQVRAYGLPSQPWLFAIDRHGRVAARIEGAFGPHEAATALRAAVTGERPRK
jgi:hypothetical protein